MAERSGNTRLDFISLLIIHLCQLHYGSNHNLNFHLSIELGPFTSPLSQNTAAYMEGHLSPQMTSNESEQELRDT